MFRRPYKIPRYEQNTYSSRVVTGFIRDGMKPVTCPTTPFPPSYDAIKENQSGSSNTVLSCSRRTTRDLASVLHWVNVVRKALIGRIFSHRRKLYNDSL